MQKVLKRCLGNKQTDLAEADALNEALYQSYTRVSLSLRRQLSANSSNSGMVKVYSIKAAKFENIINEDWTNYSGTRSAFTPVSGTKSLVIRH